MEELPKIAFVTGVSRGIGLALCKILARNGYSVYGIGRSGTIPDDSYLFLSLDLSKTDEVADFRFPQTEGSSYLLVNNAGILGEVLPVGELEAQNFIEVMSVNAIGPQILTNRFIAQFHLTGRPLHVVNISSGAGKRPIDAWAAYCSSKAALDRFSETVNLEMQLRDHRAFHIHAIEPGVVDTAMQAQIRSVPPEKFMDSQRFHDLKNEGNLQSPEQVAESLMKLITDPEKYPSPLLSVKDL